MAQDPYGFPEAAGPMGGGGAGDGGVSPTAAAAVWCGMAAALAASIGPCVCYLPYLVAIPLGGYAAWAGYQAMQRGNSAERTMGTAGMVGGGLAALLGGVVFGLFALYIIAVMAFAMIGIAADA